MSLFVKLMRALTPVDGCGPVSASRIACASGLARRLLAAHDAGRRRDAGRHGDEHERPATSGPRRAWAPRRRAQMPAGGSVRASRSARCQLLAQVVEEGQVVAAGAVVMSSPLLLVLILRAPMRAAAGRARRAPGRSARRCGGARRPRRTTARRRPAAAPPPAARRTAAGTPGRRSTRRSPRPASSIDAGVLVGADRPERMPSWRTAFCSTTPRRTKWPSLLRAMP